MTTQELCVDIIKRMIVLANEEKPVTISDDYKSENACTLTVGKYHTHVGSWNGTFEEMIKSMHNALTDNPDLSFEKEQNMNDIKYEDILIEEYVNILIEGIEVSAILKSYPSFDVYSGFDTHDDYEKFVNYQINKNDFFFVNKDIRGCLYKNNNNMYMKIKKDDYDGTVKIWSSK